jgi:hypothetical protein
MTIFPSIVIVLLLLIGIFELLRYRRNRVIDRFLEVNNVLAENAKTLDQIGITDRFSVRLLVKNELLKVVDGDRYYIDLLRFTQLGYFYRRVLSIAMTTGVVLVICVIVFLIIEY